MNLRATLILFGILAAFLAVFAGLQFYDVRTHSQRGESDKWLLPTLKTANVGPRDFSNVVVERSGEKAERMEFTKKDGEWQMVAPKAVRADGAAVDRLIDQLVRAERPSYQEPVTGDLAGYGLAQPAVKITLTLDDKKAEEIKAAAKTYTFSIGQPGDGKKDTLVYVLTSEAAKTPAAIAKTRLDRPFAPLDDYRSKELIGTTFNVDQIKLAGGKRPTIELTKVDGKDWVFKEPKLGDADGKQVDELTSALATIKIERNEDFVADGPLDEAKLGEFGLLPDKAAYLLTVRHKDAKEKTEILLIGNKDAEATRKATETNQATQAFTGALLGPVGGAALAPFSAGEIANEKLGHDGYYFAKLSDENTVVRIPGRHLKTLQKQADDLRSKALARVDGQKVDAINVAAGGETIRLRRPKLKAEGSFAAASEWVVWSDRQNKEVKAHLDVVTRLIDAVNKIELPEGKNFLDDDARQRAWFGADPIDLGLDKPAAEILFWQEGIKRDKDGKPEGTGEPALKDDVKDKPFVKLTIGKKDAKRNVVYVKRQRGDEPPIVMATPDPWLDAKAPPPPQQGTFPPPRRESISLVEQATAGYLGFRDHVLPSFNFNDTTKLAYVTPSGTFEAEKETKTEGANAGFPTWKLTKPVQSKSDNADAVLFMLSRLAAEKLVTDKATDQDRKEKYGLASPVLAATVTTSDKDKKTSTYAYAVGKKAPADGPHANHYYGRIEVKPADGAAPEANDFVFLLPVNVVKSLDLELRDPIVFAMETSIGDHKPEEITLTWRDKDKKFQETKLELAMTAEAGSDKKVWTVKNLTVDGKDAKASLAKLDVAKVEQLLGATPGLGAPRGPRLNPLFTERFLMHDAKPLAKQRLDEANKENPPALVIEIKYADKSTRKLVVGDRWSFVEDDYPGLRQKAYYLATASTVPNAVFVVAEEEFKNLLAGVDYFKAVEKVAGEPSPVRDRVTGTGD